jgi:hypothetical protein
MEVAKKESYKKKGYPQNIRTQKPSSPSPIPQKNKNKVKKS